MAIYERSAIDLMNIVHNNHRGNTFNFLGEPSYTFTYRRNYEGLMAYINPNYRHLARPKQGFYDILGNMNNTHLTHQELFDLLLEHTTLDECFTVWSGDIPPSTGTTRHALLCLAMLMFEQEINFGNEIYQRKSHFSPNRNVPNYQRPRDLLMGYIWYMFDKNNTDCLTPYQNYNGLLLPPPNGELQTNFFHALRNHPNAIALMARPNILEAYIHTAQNAPNNPNL